MIDLVHLLGLTILAFLILWDRAQRTRTSQQELELLVENRTRTLVQENAAKDLFIANIGHETSNPMNGVIGLAQSIKTDLLDTETKHKLELLSHCANHVSSLLDDILSFSLTQASGLTIESKPFTISELSTLLKALVLAESEKCRVPVEIFVSPEVPERLNGDPRRICQILHNFVVNSLKYSGSSQVRVTVLCEKPLNETSKVYFGVSDDGAGISAEEQTKLFTPFQRGSIATKSDIPGTGLGLALCKTLAEKMGGQVWVQSEPGRGCSFYFSATLHHCIDPIETPLVLVPPHGINSSLKKALVVDDEEYNRIALSGLLETLGLSVECASRDHEALTLAAAHDFDLILLDYSIPGLNGPAIAQAIRSSSNASSRALILATTAFDASEIQEQCMAAGMNAFIKKPVTMDRVRSTLSSLANHSPGAASLPPQQIDQLANLRFLAAKKNLPLARELTVFFSELEMELKQLATALSEESPSRLSYHIHLLSGRCSFIREHSLEQTLRKIERSALDKNWPHARLIALTLQTQVNDLRVRFFSEIPTVQHV